MSDRQLTVKSLVSSPAMKARFEEVLRDKAPAFLASVASQSASGPLSDVDPTSVMAAAFVAATLNLPVDRNLGFAWVVPYGGQAQFQVGYKGYIQLAQRSGQYHRMNAFAVNKESLGGFDEVGEPVIDFAKLDDSSEAVGYAFVFKLSNGFTKCVYWSKDKVERHAKKFSKGYGRGTSPWTTNFDAMALKTVTAHTLRTWGPLSTELQQGLIHDGGTMREVGGAVTFVEPEIPQIEAGNVGKNPLEQPKHVEGKEVAPEPEEKPRPALDLQADINNRCKATGIAKSRLVGHLTETGFLTEGTKFDALTAEQCEKILADWEPISEAIKG